MKLLSTIGGDQVTLELRSGSASPVSFVVDGESGDADVQQISPGAYSVIADGKSYDIRVFDREGIFDVAVNGVTYHATVNDPRRWTPGGAAAGASGPQQVKAPMPGKVVKLLVRVGDVVEAGEGVVVVEAMKMQNELKSPKTGTIAGVKVTAGGSVAAGDTLVVVE